MEPGRRSMGGRGSERPLLNVARKVQVVYYLTRNGHLEHPHYLELPHIAHRHLRLKDIMVRLMVLRGRSIPSLYSWSCKRCYKNGYVWNDLAEEDVVYPTEGGEYVLKGTELVEGYSGKIVKRLHPIEDEDGRLSSSFRCSKGVSTDEIEELQQKAMEVSIDTESPASDSSGSNINSKRFEEDETTPARNSGLIQFFCGGRKVEEEDEICCMSLNPRFGSVQSEEKEFFSGSIAETMMEERRGLEAKLVKSSSYEERRLKEVFVEKMEEGEKKKGFTKGRCIPRMMMISRSSGENRRRQEEGKKTSVERVIGSLRIPWKDVVNNKSTSQPSFEIKSLMWAAQDDVLSECQLSHQYGAPAVQISSTAMDRDALPFAQAVIVKFLGPMPPYTEFHNDLLKLYFVKNFSFTSLFFNLAMIPFECNDYLSRMLTKRLWKSGGTISCIYKSSADFHPSSEPPTAPLWTAMSNQPLYVFNKIVCYEIANMIGSPIMLDVPTSSLTRPSLTHVLTEYDMSKPLPSRVWLER